MKISLSGIVRAAASAVGLYGAVAAIAMTGLLPSSAWAIAKKGFDFQSGTAIERPITDKNSVDLLSALRPVGYLVDNR